jgi:hypothetical protein
MWNPQKLGSARVSALASAIVLTFCATAMADSDQLTVHLTASGQRIAHAAVAGDRDFAAGSGWAGKAVKPNIHEHASCAGDHPKQSDLVLLGKAESVYEFKASGWQIHTGAAVLRTPGMVAADWTRTGEPKQFLACLRAHFKTASSSSAHLVSARQSADFRLGDRAEAFRVLFDVPAKSGKHVRVMIDVILVGVGRTEITLSSTARASLAPVIEPAEIRLARILAHRAADAQHLTLK